MDARPSKRVDKLKKQLQPLGVHSFQFISISFNSICFRKLEEKLGSKLDGEELLPVVGQSEYSDCLKVRAYVILSNTEDV